MALTGAGIPPWLDRLKSRGWALVLPISIAGVVAGIAIFPQLANGLTWVALILVPPGAVLALAWALHGARPALGIVAAALFVFAWVETGTLAGDAAAALCTALSAATLGRLLAGGVPAAYLKLAIVAFAVIDAILVFGNQLQGPNAVLNAAVPAPGLPQLQYLDLHYASMGYGDVFVAGRARRRAGGRGTQAVASRAARVRPRRRSGTCCSCWTRSIRSRPPCRSPPP